MLKFLHVRNFALAEDLTIEFHEGLNILTGETGAGKSILVGAINAVLGGRVYAEIVRTGFDRATVEAIFDISRQPELKALLESHGLEPAGELILRREIARKGGTRAFVNDAAVSVNLLSAIGDRLVDIHGQHEHQSLLRAETHRYYLDAFGQLEPLLADVARLFRQLQEVQKELQTLQQRQKELEEKQELYRFQLEEIRSAEIQPDEDVQLSEERKQILNVEKLYSLTGRLEQIFSAEQVNLQLLMSEAVRALQELAGYSRELARLAEEFESTRIVVDETFRAVNEFQSSLEYNPARLEEIEARLSKLQLLKKKYGPTLEDVLNYQQKLEAELNLQENFEQEVQRLEKQFRQLQEAFSRSVLNLSEQRKQVARKLEQAIMAELEHLGMPRTRFAVQLNWQEDPSGLFLHGEKHYRADESGADQVEFFISPNPGEDFKPLSKIASGGEISRIMLALKRILASVDRIPTVIFDEIDLGVSGRIAQAVGRSIARLARSHQVLCITHLPQIAAQGAHHYVVSKSVQDGRTFTHVQYLSPRERVEEIARLMSGEKVSSSALQSARQLLEESQSQ